jgi:hypothetical protein
MRNVRTMLIEHILPRYDEREYHQIEIRGNPTEVYETVRALDFSDSFLIRTLFRLRGLPATSTNLAGLLQVGFLLVDEIPDEELAARICEISLELRYPGVRSWPGEVVY